jgi:Zn-finger nucleic acid-binding protein
MVAGEVVDRCIQCQGEFIDRNALGRLLTAVEAQTSSRAPYSRPSPFTDPVRYRKCPVCGEMMLRRNFRESSGVVVDECAAHGVWLDRGELKALMAFAASGALAKAERDIMAREAAKKQIDAWGRDLRGVGPRHYVDTGMGHGGGSLVPLDLVADLTWIHRGRGGGPDEG